MGLAIKRAGEGFERVEMIVRLELASSSVVVVRFLHKTVNLYILQMVSCVFERQRRRWWL